MRERENDKKILWKIEIYVETERQKATDRKRERES